MSARSLNSNSNQLHHVTVEARQTQLSLSPRSIVFHKGGIEFRSTTAFAPWTEMTITLRSPKDGGRVHCNGVVISCTGNKHTGYHVSMVFTAMSRQAQALMNTMTRAQA